MGNRRPTPRSSASAFLSGHSRASTGAAAEGTRSNLTTPPGGVRPNKYEGLRIEAGMAATPVGPLAEEFRFFCPLCMCAVAELIGEAEMDGESVSDRAQGSLPGGVRTSLPTCLQDVLPRLRYARDALLQAAQTTAPAVP